MARRARTRTRSRVSAGAARQRGARGDRPNPRRPSGRRRRRRHRVGKDHAAAEDLPRPRAGIHRAHSAAADRRALGRRAHRRGAPGAGRRVRGLPGAVHGRRVRGHGDHADDRRRPAQRDPPRSSAAPVRHDHHRRGARTFAERGLPSRISETNPAAAARSEGDRDVGDDRPGRVRAPLRGRCRESRARDRRARARVPGRGAVPAAVRNGSRCRRGGCDRRRAAGAGGGGPGGRAGVPAGRSGDPGCSGRGAHGLPARDRHRGARVVRPPHRSRTAPGVRTEGRGCPPPDRAGNQCGRDEPDGSWHPSRHRHRDRARFTVQRPLEGAAPADRAGVAGVGAAARGSRGSDRTRHRDPALRAGGSGTPARVHRSGGAAHQSRLRRSAAARARLGRHRSLPVPDPSRLAGSGGRSGSAGGTRRGCQRPRRADSDRDRP